MTVFRTLRADQYFAFGQFMLAGALLGCLAIVPHYFFSFDQGGVSNYGTNIQTQWLFTIGFVAAIVGAIGAATKLPRQVSNSVALRWGLAALAVLYLLVLVTTYTYQQSDRLGTLHDWVSLLLFIAMLIGSAWLRFGNIAKDVMVQRGFLIFCVGATLGIANTIGLIHLLFVVELTCGASFGYMLTRRLRYKGRKIIDLYD